MRGLAALLAAVMLIGGCRSASSHSPTVFAAASLTTTFTRLNGVFSASDHGNPADLSFAGSADLLTQLTNGAEADVLATADIATMDRAARAGLLDGRPVPFATNRLTIAVAHGNPKRVGTLRDLDHVSLVTCAPQVPCGSALSRLRSQTGARLQPVSEESSVTDVMNKVTSGQADAGLVYVTDARAAADLVSWVDFPEAPVNTYEIATLRNSRNPAAARRFVDLVTGATGRTMLADAGFGAP